MKLDEFERRFDALWDERYTTYDPVTDHWTRQRADDTARQQCRDMLTEYARSVQSVGLSRRGKNKAQRIFEELGLDPADIEFESIGDMTQKDEGQPDTKAQKGLIKYIERKAGNLTGEVRIGRVTFSKSGRTIYYGGRSFRSLVGQGFKANFYCVETHEDYWISGCKRDGSDRLYGERVPIYIDEDVREEYWTEIRRKPECKEKPVV